MEPDKRVLKDIVCRLPSPQARVAPEHLAGEFQEPFAGVIQEKALRPRITRPGEINQALELCVGAYRHLDSYQRFSRFVDHDTPLAGNPNEGSTAECESDTEKGPKKFWPIAESGVAKQGGGTRLPPQIPQHY